MPKQITMWIQRRNSHLIGEKRINRGQSGIWNLPSKARWYSGERNEEIVHSSKYRQQNEHHHQAGYWDFGNKIIF